MFKDVLPEDLYKSARPAGGELHNFELTWRYHDALKVAQILYEHGYVILGGGVYEEQGEFLEDTCDSWGVKREKNSSWQEYVQQAYIRTEHYLNIMYSRNDDKFFYSFTVQKRESEKLDGKSVFNS